MEMVRLTLLATLCAPWLGASPFTLTIGSPVAANVPVKSAGLAVRLEHCEDLSKASLTATAEGLAAGVRKSVPLQVVAGKTPGVYAVIQSWPGEGAWVVDLKAACGNFRAGAVVPFHGAAFDRQSLKIFARFATPEEVDGSLAKLSGGGR